MIETPAEMDAARGVLAEWLAAFNSKDLETLFSLYTHDSIYANSRAPIKVGLEAVKPWYAAAIPNIKGKLLHNEEAAWQSGRHASILGSYYFQPPADEAATDAEGSTGRVFLIFEKTENGDWRLAFDMDNTPEDVSSAWFMDQIA